jgi:hypothetical protein
LITVQSMSRSRVVTNQQASSPIVRPWRIGSGPAPTKLSQPGAAAILRPGARPGWAIENPHRLAVLGGGLEQVAQGGDEGVDAAAEILQVDQQDVEAGPSSPASGVGRCRTG